MTAETARRVATLVTEWSASLADQYGRVQKIASRLATVTAVLSIFVGQAVAKTANGSCGNVPPQFQEIVDLLTRIQQLGVALGLLLASIFLIYAGLLWMRGSPDAQQKARNVFVNTFIGLVIILMAGGLVEFVQSVLCGGA